MKKNRLKYTEYPRLKKLEFEIPFAKCRYKCKFCSNYSGKTVDTPLTKEETFKVVNDFIEVGGEILVVTGGEPLECPFVYEIIRCAKGGGLKVYVYTGGYLIDDNVSKKLHYIGVNKIYVTILGPEEIHDYITETTGSYKLSVNAINLCVKEGFHVGINFIPMKPNYHKWEYVFWTTAKLGVREFRITELMPQGRAWDNRDLLELNSFEYSKMLNEMTDRLPGILKTNKVEIIPEGICFGFIINESLFPLPTCSAGKTGLTITPEGFIIPCLGCRTKPGLRTPDKKYILGKYPLQSFNLIKKVWHESNVLQQFRELSVKNIGGICKNCEYLEKCKGGCPIRREIETGDIRFGPDFKCIIKNRYIKE